MSSNMSGFRRLVGVAAVVGAILPATAVAHGHDSVSITKSGFGALSDGTSIDRYTLTNARGMSISIITYGATLQAVNVPDRRGQAKDVALGFGDIAGYTSPAYLRSNPYFGATIGRYGNRIAIRATHDARYLIVTVDDDGPGIPPDQREEVFRPFFRLDEARNVDGGGTGLGLAIARDIARAHGGDIMLGDSPLGGLRATVRLPV